MAMSDAQRRQAAADLFQAEETRQWIEPITLSYEGADIDDAYAIGQYVTEAKVAAGRVVKGHKVGLTSKAMRSTTGATEPDYGTLFDNWFLDEGTQVSMGILNRPLVEIELVFVLATPLGGPDVNAVDVINATRYVLPAVEVVDSRYSKRGKAGVVDSIADAASCGFIMVGGAPKALTEIDIRQVGGCPLQERRDRGVGGGVGRDGQPHQLGGLAGPQAARVRGRDAGRSQCAVGFVHPGPPHGSGGYVRC